MKSSLINLAVALMFLLGGQVVPATAQSPILPGQDTNAKKDEKKKVRNPLISDLTDPMKAFRDQGEAPGKKGSTEAVLQMTPGLGGDPLAGLSLPESELSPDLQTLLQFARNPTSQARYRAATSPPHPGSYFPDLSTLGTPMWAERPQRDGLGRITSLTDASGTHTTFSYGPKGFTGMKVDRRGPLNADRGSAGRLLRGNPQRGFFGQYPIFNNLQWGQVTGGDLQVNPLSNSTLGLHNSDGTRSFTTHDLLGRPIYRFDARGKISFNRYGPHGNLIGSIGSDGRLTLYNHDSLGRRNFAVDSSGNRILMDQDRFGSTILQTPDGNVMRTGGLYGPQKPMGEIGTGAPERKSRTEPENSSKG